MHGTQSVRRGQINLLARGVSVRAPYVSPVRDVAGYASTRTRYLLAPYVRPSHEGSPWMHAPDRRISRRSGTGRAISLPVLHMVREIEGLSSSRKTRSVFSNDTVSCPQPPRRTALGDSTSDCGDGVQPYNHPTQHAWRVGSPLFTLGRMSPDVHCSFHDVPPVHLLQFLMLI